MSSSVLRPLLFLTLAYLTMSPVISVNAQLKQASSRLLLVDINDSTGPVDRFFDLSVGSDYPGTLIRDDSQAQLKVAVDELGFRYIRFHGIFHDVLETVRVEDGKTVYNWAKIDQPYDDLQARHIKPFVELVPAHAADPVKLEISHLFPNTAYQLETHRTGYRANDAYSAYIEMGSPKELTKAQIACLNELTRDLAETDKAVRSGVDGAPEFFIPMNSNDIVLVKLKRSQGGN